MGNCHKQVYARDTDESKRAQLQEITFETASDPLYRFTEAKVIKVYDGDTFWIAAWHAGEICKFSVRLYGIDCAEIRGGTSETKQAAQEAKQFVVDKIMGKIIRVQILNNTFIDGKKVTEKYGRLLARVRTNTGDLAEEMIKLGLGYPYYGGTKEHD